MTTIDDVLETIRSSSENSKEVGDKFERLMLAFFRTDPAYKRQFSEVWMWGDWPGNEGKPDTGIDLVAKNVDDDGFTAIQCKCYAPTTSLDKSDIDSFFTASGKEAFTQRIIVATTNNWSRHAEDALLGQAKPVRRIGVEALEDSSIDWGQWDLDRIEDLARKPRKTERPHQSEAIDATAEGFKTNDRGKLIMACGTGKTYTAQRIAEQQVGPGGSVLILLPSISLLSQTLKEWTSDASIPIAVYAVCSDSKAGKKRSSEDISPYELLLPATTDPELLVKQYRRAASPEKMSVIFSTYQSLPVLSAAQQAGVPEFDLVICDEAHRTTGVTLKDQEDSHFTRVHDNAHINAAKRLYMTATPRVFSDAAKGKAQSADAWLASMDDKATFGPEFHRLGFHEAVQRDLLTDYKVLVLAVDEAAVSAAFQKQLSDEDHELKLDDATRIVGCVNALAKLDVHGETFGADDLPMQRAVAFSNTIAQSKKFKGLFAEIANQWNSTAGNTGSFNVEVDHVDGKHNSMQREDMLRWLKDDSGEHGCRILSNAKCLTEGVDVPDLDAIMFLEPRNSMVDVIQAVGRVMRKADGKDFGYVILPVGIPADITPEQALNDNKRFKAVWQVLNALRSHDERMNAVINQLDLNEEPPDMIEVIPVGPEHTEDDSDPESSDEAEKPRQLELSFPLDQLKEGIYAKLVLKVGTRHYWEDWAKDVAEIAEKHQTRIKALINDPNLDLSEPFTRFVEGLHTIINDSITADDAIGMLSQHLITKPVFDALFTEFDFSSSNPVSQVMQNMIDLLDEHSLNKETETLEKFYDSVRLRVEGIDNAAGKQRIITELYEGFFSKAFPKAAESLGIVYTPVELVDFTLHATDHALRRHFDGTSISDEGIDVLDPFCGTGTFIVRLLQSGIIKPKDFARKYQSELHSNELLLLAYYIAAINIESTYHDEITKRNKETEYVPFNGIVLTDTFQMGETGDGTGNLDVFPINNERAELQKKTTIEVVVGNPPYSAVQKSQNDNNQNLSYELLDASIAQTYTHHSTAQLSQNLYDSYTRAFRRASDLVLSVDGGGVVSFVTNGGFIEGRAFDGFRKTLASEFHHIYCYNLRGNQRTAGEQSRKEGGKVFGSGSRATIAITILVKEPGPVPETGALIHYNDIGDYLTREEKLAIIQDAANASALDNIKWETIIPNKDGDWINQRSERFQNLIPLFSENSNEVSVFNSKAVGLVTSRDAWNYNSSLKTLKENTTKAVNFYNNEVEKFQRKHPNLSGNLSEKVKTVTSFVNLDPTKFSWDVAALQRVAKGLHYDINDEDFYDASYRPFYLQRLNFSQYLSARRSRFPDIFPHPDSKNLVILTSGPASSNDFHIIMTDTIPCLDLLEKTACYPLFIYLQESGEESTLFDSPDPEERSFNVNEKIISFCEKKYGKSLGSPEDIFYFVYGALHDEDYRSKFQNDLKKGRTRISFPEGTKEFTCYVAAGRELGELHVNYESVDPWDDLEIEYSDAWNPENPESYRVQKMRYKKNGKIVDKTTVIYNSMITISGIPETAHDYRLGSRSAIDWIIDRYQIRTHKESGIVNDPNDWADEHDDPTYIFDLLRRIVTVSMRTNEIVAGLPKLDFEDAGLQK